MPLTRAEISRLRALREKRVRQEAGLYVVEGPKVVAELLAHAGAVSELYALPAWEPGAPPPVPVIRVTPAEMDRISHFPTPSTVLAVGRMGSEALAPGELERGYTLALDGVQDPGNVGTLLRIADWFGFDRVLLSPDCADRFSQKVINASMGSFLRVRTVTAGLPAALEGVRVPVLGCDLRGEPLHALAPPAAAVVVIGSEGRGLSPTVEQRLTRRVTIPRIGRAESLNAAVAAGIVCAHLRRPAATSPLPAPAS